MSIGEEIRASAAAHRDLGPAYDTALAEGLVERIGDEIDRRVDARLYAHTREAAPPGRRRLRAQRAEGAERAEGAAAPGRLGAGSVILALGSMGLAIGATGTVLHPGGGVHGGEGPLVALIWIVIGIINVSYARRH